MLSSSPANVRLKSSTCFVLVFVCVLFEPYNASAIHQELWGTYLTRPNLGIGVRVKGGQVVHEIPANNCESGLEPIELLHGLGAERHVVVPSLC